MSPSDTDRADLEQQVRDALNLMKVGYVLYAQADEPLRQQLSKAVFKRILIGPEPDQIVIEINDTYQHLTDGSGPLDQVPKPRAATD